MILDAYQMFDPPAQLRAISRRSLAPTPPAMSSTTAFSPAFPPRPTVAERGIWALAMIPR